jgi:hypothetical protein
MRRRPYTPAPSRRTHYRELPRSVNEAWWTFRRATIFRSGTRLMSSDVIHRSDCDFTRPISHFPVEAPIPLSHPPTPTDSHTHGSLSMPRSEVAAVLDGFVIPLNEKSAWKVRAYDASHNQTILLSAFYLSRGRKICPLEADYSCWLPRPPTEVRPRTL